MPELVSDAEVLNSGVPGMRCIGDQEIISMS